MSNIYWTFFIIHILYSQTFAILTGIARFNTVSYSPSKFLCVAFGFHWAGYGFIHFSFVFVAIYYGKKLVEFTKNSFTLAGVNDDLDSISSSDGVTSNNRLSGSRNTDRNTRLLRINQNIRKVIKKFFL